MISSEKIREYMVLDAIAKSVAAQAKDLKLELQGALVDHPEQLKGMNVGDFELRLENTKVDWNADVIQTITEIDGVSERDKSELFHLPVKRANGVKLNSLHKKYGGSVAKRIDMARQESGTTLKISANRVVRDSINQEAEKRLPEKPNSEGETSL